MQPVTLSNKTKALLVQACSNEGLSTTGDRATLANRLWDVNSNREVELTSNIGILESSLAGPHSPTQPGAK
jgi:hypothetical protein